MTEPAVALDDEQRRQLLAAFLKSRRARVSPADRGYSPGPRRRTPGLRREELASLANVGVAWYTAMEQAQDVRPSAPILASLARVLGLSSEERRHLFFLAGQFDPDLKIPLPGKVTPAVDLILRSLSPHPAYVLDTCWNYVAWNAEAAELFGLRSQPATPINLVWELFTDPGKRRLYSDWGDVALNVVSEFRAAVEPVASLAEVADLVRRLVTLPEFAQLWSAHPIVGTIDRRKTLNHPRLGQLILEYTTMSLAAHDSLRMIVYTPAS